MKRSITSLLEEACTQLFVEGNAEAAVRFFSRDYIAHVTDGDMRGGHELIRSVVALYRKAFPDLSVEVSVLVETADHVAWQRTMRGKHVGAFKGFPATGQDMVWREMVVSRIVAGLVTEEWVVTELAERLLLARKGLFGKASGKNRSTNGT